MKNGKWTLHIIAVMALMVFMFLGLACATKPRTRTPESFTAGSGGDTMVLLRQGLDADQAFREIIFILNRHGFQPEMMNPEAGFLRTRWNTTWTTFRDGSKERYRVSVIILFNPNRTQVILQAPAEFSRDGGTVWIEGYDRKAIDTLRNDITMAIGN